jgi:hypothetical protein
MPLFCPTYRLGSSKAGIRILIWLRDHYKEGSRFYSNGNTVQFFHYDAGHNQYASDSKAHHGHVAVFAGGPVGNESKKHEDLGDSTPYNEYMALYWCGRRPANKKFFNNFASSTREPPTRNYVLVCTCTLISGTSVCHVGWFG